MNRSANVAVFVPHLGCGHRCSFCNQNGINGDTGPVGTDGVTRILEHGLATLGGNAKDAQIAFFGGSFTSIPRDQRILLLEAAQPFLREGGYGGIRISARPDAIDEGILDELESYGVTAIELGVQSMDDGVLSANNRGHTAEDVEKASALIRERGFSLGHHMMTGLYGSNQTKDLYTARRLIALKPDTVRIHPALVLEGTKLARLHHEGKYIPQDLEGAVELCTELLKMFNQAGVTVIRMGLHDTPGLNESLVAGPYHPAFRELCEGKIMLGTAVRLLYGAGPGKVRLAVNPGYVSRMTGQNRRNLRQLKDMGYRVKIVTDEGLEPLEVRKV